MKKLKLRVVCIMLVTLLCSANMFASSEKIVDWNGKLENEEQIPDWLRSMRRGNAVAYCQEYGLNSKINRKWLIPVGVESLVGWEDGRLAASAQAFAALGQSICTDIEAALGSDQNNGARSTRQSIVLKSITTVSGIEFEGYHWYEVEKEVITGRNKKGKPVKSKQHVWYVYAFYSMDANVYNTQLQMAIGNIARANGFTKEEAAIIAAGASGGSLNILSEQYRRSKDFQQKIQEEQQKQRLAWDAQQMNIQQAFVDQQIDSLNRTQAMAESNQRNQNDLTNRNATNNYNQQTLQKSYQNQIDNRNIDTEQLQIQGDTQQLESRNRANVQMAQANAASNATQSIAQSGSAAGAAGQFGSNPNIGNSEDSGNKNQSGGMNDSMAFLMGL